MSVVSQSKKKPTSGKGRGASSSKSLVLGYHHEDGSYHTASGAIVTGKHHQQQLNRFLSKTFHMVNNIDVDVVSWNPKGDSFVIEDIDEFSKTTLPLYFNHSNYSSFVRQLNFYGFTKVRLDCSPLKKEEDEKQQTVCFYHEYFRKDRPDLLHKIHRVTKKSRDDGLMSAGYRVRELQREVDSMHDEMRLLQSQMESKLVEVKQSMQREYEKRISDLEQTCMGMIVLLQQSTSSTCSSSPAPSSLYPHPHSSFLSGYSSSCRLSSSSSSSSSSPPMAGGGVPRSFWPGELSAAAMIAPTVLRRDSWGGAANSTTPGGPVTPHHHVADAVAPLASMSTTSLLLSLGKYIKSSSDTSLMKSSGFNQ